MGSSIAERVLAGEVRSAARLMRDLDDGIPSARRTLRELFPHTGRAQVIGLTGSPGAGKSSLTERLIAHHREAKRQVGVIAVDPTSPFSGGALLGDRIRMQEHAVDPGVFIRSMATRGNLGGLSRATSEIVQVMDAMGKEIILVETVGVGQDEVEVAQLAHTVVVLAVPGMGDDVQAIKAGVLEIADVFAVNKADREGADRTVKDLQQMLELRRVVQGHLEHDAQHRMTTSMSTATAITTATSIAGGIDMGWEPPIVKTVAIRGEGVPELCQAIERHRAHLVGSGELGRRNVARARAAFVALLRDRMLAGALEKLAAERGQLDEIAARIAARQADPYALVDELAERLR
jgi:LAO/AO transport system kinase